MISNTRRAFAWMWLGVAMLPYAVMAAEPETAKLTNFGDIIEAGGMAMKVIIVLSVFATFLVLFFLFSLRAGVLFPAAFVRDAENAASSGDFEALKALCRENDSAAAKIIGSAAEHADESGASDYMIIRDAIEDEGARQAGILWQRIQYLMDVAVIAPMVGLLGTVVGMLQSFSGLQTELGIVKPTALAQGVSKALITTAGGLIVGITGMILYAIFRGRVSKLIGGLESACNRVLRRLMAKATRR